MNTQRLSQVRRRIVSKIKVKGQGMTEYLVILGLIAISAIAVFSFFGQTLRNQVAGMSQEVGGKTGSAEVTKAQTAAGTVFLGNRLLMDTQKLALGPLEADAARLQGEGRTVVHVATT